MKSFCWRPAKLGFALAIMPLLCCRGYGPDSGFCERQQSRTGQWRKCRTGQPGGRHCQHHRSGCFATETHRRGQSARQRGWAPQSVAISRDESFALVTGAFKVDPADPKKAIPDNKLSVIDLKAKPPAVIATLEAGWARLACRSTMPGLWRWWQIAAKAPCRSSRSQATSLRRPARFSLAIQSPGQVMSRSRRMGRVHW